MVATFTRPRRARNLGVSWVRAMRLIYPLMQLATGIAIILVAGPMFWARLGVGLCLCGFAIRRVAVDRRWAFVRRHVGIGQTPCLRVAFSLYVAAGAAGGIAGFKYLGRGGGAIVAFFMLSWIWMWASLLWGSIRWDERAAQGSE